MARKLKVFRTHIGFDDLIIASPSRKAALDAWGASAHLFTQGFAAETNEPALVKAALARPGTVLRRQFGSQGEFKAERPALRLVESPAKAEPKAPAKAAFKKPATKNPAKPRPLHEAVPTGHASRAKREQAATDRAERRAAEAQVRAEARQRETERKEAAAEHRRDLQSQLQSLQDERKQQLGDIDRREQDLARERREIEQSFETRIVALQRRLRKA